MIQVRFLKDPSEPSELITHSCQDKFGGVSKSVSKKSDFGSKIALVTARSGSYIHDLNLHEQADFTGDLKWLSDMDSNHD